MSTFSSKHSFLIIHTRRWEIKAFYLTGQFWFKTARLNILVGLLYLNTI